MKAQVELKSPQASGLESAVAPGLESDDTVNYAVTRDGERLTVEVETDSLGPLRGATDTVFRHVMLAEKILTR